LAKSQVARLCVSSFLEDDAYATSDASYVRSFYDLWGVFFCGEIRALLHSFNNVWFSRFAAINSPKACLSGSLGMGETITLSEKRNRRSLQDSEPMRPELRFKAKNQ